MENPFDEVRKNLDKAKLLNKAADDCADSMARILKGRLRHVSPYVLDEIKKELTQFDAKRKVWKSK